MQPSEFDKFADEYEDLHRGVLGPSGESLEFFAEYKAIDTARQVRKRKAIHKNTILDFGCGVGGAIPYLSRHLPDHKITGLDVSQKSLDLAKKRVGNMANLLCFDGKTIPFSDNHFDVVFTACVFHHIPFHQHRTLFAEILRVIQPGGFFILFEHNPANWLTVRAVNQCPFDENAVLFRPGYCRKLLDQVGFVNSKHSYRVFFPAFLRLLRPMERAMSWLPLGAQYYVCSEKPE